MSGWELQFRDPRRAWLVRLGVGALLLATIVTMIFGELYPKNLAIASPEPLARALAVPTSTATRF